MAGTQFQSVQIPVVEDLAAAARLASDEETERLALFSVDLAELAQDRCYQHDTCIAVRQRRSHRRPSWIMATRRFSLVTKLAVLGIEVTAAGAAAIADGLPSLTDVEFAVTTLGHDGLEAFINALHHPGSVDRLGLAHTSIDRDAIELITARLPHLRYLDVSFNALGDDVATVIPQNFAALKHLDLSGNDLSSNAIDAIADALPELKRLALDSDRHGITRQIIL